jgi:hypothetical protein
MSQAINLCKDSDDKGEWSSTNAASVPPLSRKRPLDNEESCKNYVHHLSNENDPGNKPATGSPDFVIDLVLAGEV